MLIQLARNITVEKSKIILDTKLPVTHAINKPFLDMSMHNVSMDLYDKNLDQNFRKMRFIIEKICKAHCVLQYILEWSGGEA